MSPSLSTLSPQPVPAQVQVQRTHPFRPWARSWIQGDRHPYLLVFCIAICSYLLVAAIAGIREPVTHDEFSYLIAGDMFRHGKVCYPPHPHWEFFETFHVLSTPNYASKYPPLQGLFLALGFLTGMPILGIWLSGGLMTIACLYMFRAWLPRQWAMLGTALMLLKFGFSCYWVQSYWGGAVATLGAALVLGGLKRVIDRKRALDVVYMTLGMLVLLFSRPFEGFCASLVPGAVFLGVLATVGWKDRLRLFLPFLLLISAGLGAQLAYNKAITGKPLTMPYMVYQKEYIPIPIFIFQEPLPTPAFRHPEFARYLDVVEPVHYKEERWLPVLISLPIRNLFLHWNFLVGFFLALPLINLPLVLRSKSYWIPAAIVFCVTVGMAISIRPFSAHYYAPIVPALYVLIVKGLQEMGSWRPSRGRYNWGVIFVVIGTLVLFLNDTGKYLIKFTMYDGSQRFSTRRDQVLHSLPPGKNLVFVKYSHRHDIHQEWVYNTAPIDSNNLVWARYADPAKNQELIRYYPDRKVWYLLPDSSLQLFSYDVPLLADTSVPDPIADAGDSQRQYPAIMP